MRTVQLYPEPVYKILADHWMQAAGEVLLLTLTAFMADAILRHAWFASDMAKRPGGRLAFWRTRNNGS